MKKNVVTQKCDYSRSLVLMPVMGGIIALVSVFLWVGFTGSSSIVTEFGEETRVISTNIRQTGHESCVLEIPVGHGQRHKQHVMITNLTNEACDAVWNHAKSRESLVTTPTPNQTCYWVGIDGTNASYCVGAQ